MEYEDFDLQVDQIAEAFRVRVLRSPCGEASGTFEMPFSDLEIENFQLRFAQSYRGTRGVEASNLEAAKKFGGQLFNSVFTGEVRARLLGSVEKTKSKSRGLRIRLRLKDVPRLAEMPWEYLYHQDLNQFFSLSIKTPIVRYMDLGLTVEPLAVKPPLRVLVMISSPSDYPPLNVSQEWAKLQEALSDLRRKNLIILDAIENPTLSNLRRQLDNTDYNIFHFIGHGAYDVQSQDGALIFQKESGQGDLVGAQRLSILFHDQPSLCLALLNSCEGAYGSARDPFAGTAQSMVQQGVPAVIAMQSAITDQAAITMSHEFYLGIAAGNPVDTALSQARKAMFTEGFGVEWGTPVLYLRAPNGRIFDVTPSDIEAAPLSPAEPLIVPRVEANLSPPIGALDSESPFYIIRPEDKNAVAEIKEAKEGVTYTIVGPRQVGKTSLLYRIIDAAVEAQMQVALLDFQQLDLSDLQDSDKFFARFCHVLAHELGIPDRLDEYWNPRLGNLQRCSDYVGNYILRTLDRPLLLAMDEVETLFDSPVRSEFFAMLRVWHNNRAMRMRPLWKRLYIVIVTSTEPHYFIESLNQSPFNVATEVPLRDFIDTEIIELNRRYGLPLTQAQLKRLFSVVGGHPHLIHQSLYLVARGTIAPDKLFVSAIDESHPFFDYLRNLLLRLQKNTQMAKCLREVIDTKQCEDLRLFFRLQSAGLVKREGAKVVIRCQLYENFFREYLHA